MRIDVIIGGYMIDARGIRQQLPALLNPSNSITEELLRSVSTTGKGVVVMRCKQPPESGPYELEMHVDGKYFMLMLNVLGEDGEHSVRTPTNEDAGNDVISILGEKYPAKVVTRDISFVHAVFKEFSDSGNVSSNLMR